MAGIPYRSKTILQGSFWLAAVVVSFITVIFDKLVELAQEHYFQLLETNELYPLVLTPILFLIATAMVVYFAPLARGSGIPQALKAMMLGIGSHHTAMNSGLISVRTATVKVISATLGILGGASIGREGPTVQVSTAIFAWIGSRTKKVVTYADFHSYLVAGAAAGVSAAFNTPLAGITFALEEMAEGSFAQIKQTVMISVIIAGVATQTLVGNYAYFGRPALEIPEVGIVVPAIAIGVAGGILGAIFARLLIMNPAFSFKRGKWWKICLLSGVVCALLNYFTGGQTAGTGYEITKTFMDNPANQGMPFHFPLTKLGTTLFSFWSGMAGGIFSPSLAIGSGLGSVVGELAQFGDLKVCGLLGMVAFFTGTIHAPLTAFIIVIEMTDVHQLIIPLMISAFVAQGTSKLLMPVSLYRQMAHKFF